MKRILRPMLCMIITLSLILGCTSIAPIAAGDGFSFYDIGTTGETRNEDIVNGNSYNRYASVVRNYLRAIDGGYMRLYGSDNGTVLVEYYNTNFGFVGNRYIDSGLPLFGGFHESKNYYIIVTGQANPQQNDSVEVIRVSFFDKNWNLKGSDSLYGANTSMPFVGGRCAFAEYDKHIVIRATHEMYTINDRIHQASLTMLLNTDTLKITRKHTDPAHILTAGYLSHSLNQFVDIDSDGTVVCLDHGDALPRSAALGRYLTKANALQIFDNNYQTYEYTDLITYYGSIGDNYTAAMIGGLYCSDDAYITVGTVAGQDADYRSNKGYNAYFTVTEKASDISKAKTSVHYLTSFKESDGRYASNPRLVKINSNSFVIMWNEFPVSQFVVGVHHDYNSDYRMKYVFIDGKGNMQSDIMTAPDGIRAYVSGCEPIVDGNRIMWYVSDGSVFSSIVIMDFSGRIRVRENIVPTDLFQYPIDLSEVHTVFRTFDKLPDTTVITADNFEQYVAPVYHGKVLSYGRDYTLASDVIMTYSKNGYIRTVDLYLKPVTSYSYFPLQYSYNWSANDYDPRISSVTRESSGVKVVCNFFRGVGVHIYRSEVSEDGPFILVGTVDDRVDSEYLDVTASPYKEYFYVLREYTYDTSNNKVLSEYTSAVSIPAVGPEPTADPNAPKILGDADGDGELTILDATAIQRQLAGLPVTAFVQLLADADEDGEVTILDATSIQRNLASLPTHEGIGEPMR